MWADISTCTGLPVCRYLHVLMGLLVICAVNFILSLIHSIHFKLLSSVVSVS